MDLKQRLKELFRKENRITASNLCSYENMLRRSKFRFISLVKEDGSEMTIRVDNIIDAMRDARHLIFAVEDEVFGTGVKAITKGNVRHNRY